MARKEAKNYTAIGMSFEDYLAANGLSNSSMEELRKSPAHYKYRLENPLEPTDSMTFGSLVHCAILEPDELSKRYAPKPDGYDGRSKEGRDLRKGLEEQGLQLVDSADYLDAIRIAKEVYELKDNNLGDIIAGAVKEFSIFWADGKVQKKGRPDAYYEDAGGICLDVKTTRSPTIEAFEREVWNRGYHRKAAHYREGLRANDKPCKHIIFIAVDNSPGYRDFLVYLMRPDIIDLGQAQNNQIVEVLRECLRGNYWPGYPKKVLELGVPFWAINKLNEDELI